jgi:hypothetical protein
MEKHEKPGNTGGAQVENRKSSPLSPPFILTTPNTLCRDKVCGVRISFYTTVKNEG